MTRSLARFSFWSFWVFVALVAAGISPAAAAASHKFVGADKCKMCHNAPAKGAQFAKWAASPHARAWQTLASEEAKKVAAAKGIADPQKADACLRCHVTAHGVAQEQLAEKYKASDGVSCESCHGPGGDYWKMEIMKDRAKSVAAGMIVPDESTCKGCHNPDSPTFKGFDFEQALEKVAHPNPQRSASR